MVPTGVKLIFAKIKAILVKRKGKGDPFDLGVTEYVQYASTNVTWT